MTYEYLFPRGNTTATSSFLWQKIIIQAIDIAIYVYPSALGGGLCFSKNMYVTHILTKTNTMYFFATLYIY